MIKTIIALTLFGGMALGATLFKFGTARSGRSYIEKRLRYNRRYGRTYYGGGHRYGK